ncbi:MAG: AraC family transcriptional regulator [Ruminococcaceae bacterium]|nr:AraC family transcriptional regulator [Oscillospiraceae bacterium]
MKLNTPIKGEDFFFERNSVTETYGKRTNESHYHNMFEIYYITSGECSYFIDNKTYSLLPGDIILIPEGVIHNTEYNSIHSRLLINCSKSFIPTSIRDILPPMTYLYRNPGTIDEINGIFAKIEKEYYGKDLLRNDILTCYTHMLFFIIARNISTCETIDGKNAHIEKAIDYMKQNFSSSVTLPEIASICNISPEHFSRIFKNETGFTFSEYLNFLRLKKAHGLLLHSRRDSVAKISSMCGFNDSNYFSIKFKQMYGISPKKLQMNKK